VSAAASGALITIVTALGWSTRSVTTAVVGIEKVSSGPLLKPSSPRVTPSAGTRGVTVGDGFAVDEIAVGRGTGPAAPHPISGPRTPTSTTDAAAHRVQRGRTHMGSNVVSR